MRLYRYLTKQFLYLVPHPYTALHVFGIAGDSYRDAVLTVDGRRGEVAEGWCITDAGEDVPLLGILLYLPVQIVVFSSDIHHIRSVKV